MATVKNSKEIGSEFWYENIKSDGEFEKIFPSKVEYFMSGRSAVFYLIDLFKLKKKKILIPAYMCDSVINCFIESQCELFFYDINKKFFALYSDEILLKVDVAFVCDYWGVTKGTENLILKLKEGNKLIIQDVTHSLFSHGGISEYADAWVGSVRKWFAVPSGGIACINPNSTKNKLKKYKKLEVLSDYVEKREQAFELKKIYMSTGNYRLKRDYQELFETAETILDNCIGCIDSEDNSQNIIRSYPIKRMISQRRKNFMYLLKNFCCTDNIYPAIMNLRPEDTPLFFPIFAENRDDVKMYFISKKIYTPIHWPKFKGITKIVCPEVQWIYDHILSIPCDQRYSEEDMQTICEWSKKID